MHNNVQHEQCWDCYVSRFASWPVSSLSSNGRQQAAMIINAANYATAWTESSESM